MIFSNKSVTWHEPYSRCDVFKVYLSLDKKSCLFVNHHKFTRCGSLLQHSTFWPLQYEIFMIVIGIYESIGNVSTKARELDTCISLRMNEVGTYFY